MTIRVRHASTAVVLAVLAAAAVYWTASRTPAARPPGAAGPAAPAPAAQQPGSSTGDNALVAKLYAEHRSNVVVEVTGEVERTLRDDTQGSPHQRFVVRLSPKLTVLVAHNTGLAPRVPVHRGSVVRIRGEYEWSAQGGVLHWTHHDPQHRHQDGWIEFNGQRYR